MSIKRSRLGGLCSTCPLRLTMMKKSSSCLAPELLPSDSLSTGYAGAERWEGVLVKVEDVVITFVNQFGGWYWHTYAGTDSLQGYEKMIAGQVVPPRRWFIASATGTDFSVALATECDQDSLDVVRR